MSTCSSFRRDLTVDVCFMYVCLFRLSVLYSGGHGGIELAQHRPSCVLQEGLWSALTASEQGLNNTRALLNLGASRNIVM